MLPPVQSRAVGRQDAHLGEQAFRERPSNKLSSHSAQLRHGQEKLALLARVTRQTIGSIETGQYNPSALLALAPAQCLEKRVEDLFYLGGKAMNTDQPVRVDERTAAVAYKANTWGLNFITGALLIDIMYRGWFLDEAAWDLFGLLFVSGTISMVYMARHQVLGQVINWKVAIIGFVVAAVISAVSAFLAMN